MPNGEPSAGSWIRFKATGRVFSGLVVWIGNGVYYVAVVGYNGLMYVKRDRVEEVLRRKPEPLSFA